jgi:hypothetical protein
MDDLCKSISTNQPFTEPRDHKQEEEKRQLIPLTPPETPMALLIDSVEVAQADQAIDVLETVYIPVSITELVNTLRLPQVRAGSPSTRHKEAVQQKAMVNSSVALVEASPSPERELHIVLGSLSIPKLRLRRNMNEE